MTIFKINNQELLEKVTNYIHSGGPEGREEIRRAEEYLPSFVVEIDGKQTVYVAVANSISMDKLNHLLNYMINAMNRGYGNGVVYDDIAYPLESDAFKLFGIEDVTYEANMGLIETLLDTMDDNNENEFSNLIKGNLSIDDVLDKINEYGIKSLNRIDIEILKSLK
jgi:hypothetical protein